MLVCAVRSETRFFSTFSVCVKCINASLSDLFLDTLHSYGYVSDHHDCSNRATAAEPLRFTDARKGFTEIVGVRRSIFEAENIK